MLRHDPAWLRWAFSFLFFKITNFMLAFVEQASLILTIHHLPRRGNGDYTEIINIG